MPREHVYAQLVTVPLGDPTAEPTDRSQLDPPTAPGDADVLRRRHQLLSQFTNDLATRVASRQLELPADLTTELRDLLAQLDRLPLDAYRSPFRAPGHAGPHLPLRNPAVTELTSESRDVLGERRVQLRLVLTWTRDFPTVYLALDGWDHDAGEVVDLGGPTLELDWPALNKLRKKIQVARDQSCGTPE